MKINREKVYNYLENYYKNNSTPFDSDFNSFFNLTYGLVNNCPECLWYPCICKELKNED